MIILIDNYDSFVYNLYQLVGSIDSNIEVYRNDKISVAEIEAKNPSAIFLSPGPGHPSEAGICMDVVKSLAGKFKIFGVCLGHQAICEAFGGVVSHAKNLMHGKKSLVDIDNDSVIFANMPKQIEVARYHSLATEEASLPDCLRIISKSNNDEIMAIEHKEYKVYGVQFHPESILTPDGKQIIQNFLTDL